MKNLLTASAAIALLAASTSYAQTAAHSNIVITPQASQKAYKGGTAQFEGQVDVRLLFQPQAPARTSAGVVSFEPGARTAWHTHPLGQTLIVTSGKGWIQEWDKPKRDLQQGDVVWIPPGVKHWHGATSSSAMSHIAVQEALEGQVVTWLEQVPQAVYGQ